MDNQINIQQQYNTININYIIYYNYLKFLYNNIIIYFNKKGPIFNYYYKNLQTYETTYLLLLNKDKIKDVFILFNLLKFNKIIYLSKEGQQISALENKKSYTTIKTIANKIVYCLENDYNIDGYLVSF